MRSDVRGSRQRGSPHWRVIPSHPSWLARLGCGITANGVSRLYHCPSGAGTGSQSGWGGGLMPLGRGRYHLGSTATRAGPPAPSFALGLASGPTKATRLGGSGDLGGGRHSSIDSGFLHLRG